MALPVSKVIPNTGFVVDGFKLFDPTIKAYFLSHAHSDHYTGITERWEAGPIYCSHMTGRLVVHLLGVDAALVHGLPMDTPQTIHGVEVTLVDANHCPGAVQLLFRLPTGERYVHCGDMRFCTRLLADPHLGRFRGANAVFLDTTYCNPRFTFPLQEEAIEYVASTIERLMKESAAGGPSRAFLIATYVIGKERILVEVARRCRCKILVTERKLGVMRCLDLPGLDPAQMFTLDQSESRVNVVTMDFMGETWPYFRPNFVNMEQIRTELGVDEVHGVVPTGWMYEMKRKAYPVRSKEACHIHLVPYSEHSSYNELREYVRFLKPHKVIPTVGVHDDDSGKKSHALLKHFRNLVDETASKARFLSTFRRRGSENSNAADSAPGNGAPLTVWSASALDGSLAPDSSGQLGGDLSMDLDAAGALEPDAAASMAEPAHANEAGEAAGPDGTTAGACSLAAADAAEAEGAAEHDVVDLTDGPSFEVASTALDQLQAILGDELSPDAAEQLLQRSGGDVSRAVNMHYDASAAAAEGRAGGTERCPSVPIAAANGTSTSAPAGAAGRQKVQASKPSPGKPAAVSRGAKRRPSSTAGAATPSGGAKKAKLAAAASGQRQITSFFGATQQQQQQQQQDAAVQPAMASAAPAEGRSPAGVAKPSSADLPALSRPPLAGSTGSAAGDMDPHAERLSSHANASTSYIPAGSPSAQQATARSSLKSSPLTGLPQQPAGPAASPASKPKPTLRLPPAPTRRPGSRQTGSAARSMTQPAVKQNGGQLASADGASALTEAAVLPNGGLASPPDRPAGHVLREAQPGDQPAEDLAHQPVKVEAKAKCMGMLRPDNGSADTSKAPADAVLQSIQEYDPVKMACWQAGQPTPYLHIANGLQAMERTTKRLRIGDAIANIFRSILALAPEDLLQAAYLVIGKLVPDYEGLELNVGPSIVAAAVAEATGITRAKLRDMHNQLGDMGDVAQACRHTQMTLHRPAPLTVRGVYRTLRQIASEKGSGSSNRRQRAILGMLRSCRESETKFLVRTLVQNLRVGANWRSVIGALARAVVVHQEGLALPKARLDAAAAAASNAFHLCPSLDILVPALVEGGVDELERRCTLTPGVPLKPMLAKISEGIPDVLKQLKGEAFLAEYKYDGQRAQIHMLPDRSVRIFSRNCDDKTTAFPDVCEAITAAAAAECQGLVLDAELVAVDRANGNRLRAFQELSTRARGEVTTHQVLIQVCVFVFDLLYLDGQPLVAQCLRERRARIATALPHLRPGYVELATSVEICPRPALLGLADGVVAAGTGTSPRAASRPELPSTAAPVQQGAQQAAADADVKVSADAGAEQAVEQIGTPAADSAQAGAVESGAGPGGALQAAQVEAKVEAKVEERLQEVLLEAFAGGTEGLMLKCLDVGAAYQPSKRSDSWIKLKRDYCEGLRDSLDLVPIGAWYGNGRKAGWFSPFLLAAWDPDTEEFQSVCRCMSGFTDAFYTEATARMKARQLAGPKPYYRTDECPDVWFEAAEVWEIRGADLTLSPVHKAAVGHLHPERGVSLRFPRCIRIREDKRPEDASGPDVICELYHKQTRKMTNAAESLGKAKAATAAGPSLAGKEPVAEGSSEEDDDGGHVEGDVARE